MRNLVVAMVFAIASPTASWGGDEVAVDYARDVKPLLTGRCAMCHGALRQESGLRLDTAVLARQGGDSGPGFVPGKSSESLLIDAITRTENRMPAEGEPLSEAEIATLRRWIDAGAPAPDEPTPADPRNHWAFQPVDRPDVPTTGQAAGLASPIDALVARKREQHGLSPVAPADKGVLLRRVFLDLIGLPPTRNELHAFLGDTSPDAYERVVDDLLARPQHGERWARHWMDVWRYSDWAGYGKEVRDSQQHVWHWRDWIVESLNADRGYDRMIVDMLAGDEVAPGDAATLRATGYLARNWYRFNRNVWLDNTVEHTGKAFLGITLNCARCHDHRYDPLAQTDYYRFRAFFEPHEVRIDGMPDQPNLDADGIARIYDAHHDRKTFLFTRGMESQPKEDEPLAPGVPASLRGDELKIQPIALPAPAYYAGLRAHVRNQQLAASRSAVEKAHSSLAEARDKMTQLREQLAKATADPPAASADNATAPAGSTGVAASAPAIAATAALELETALAAQTAAVVLAEKHQATVEAEQASIVLRIAADDARYAMSPAADAAERIAQANVAAHRAATLAADEALYSSQQKLAELTAAETAATKTAADATAPASKPGAAEKAKEQRQKAETALAEASKKLETLRAAADKPPEYPPLDKVYAATSTGRRLALARWIASRNNPLTARVAVNHLWMHHFGEPLVPTVFDFGMNGKPPTNPELLDWLASELVDRGWSMKAMHRLIVTSQTYRLRSTSAADDPRRKVDPDNRCLWRANPRRMEAEAVRDSVLCVAGALDLARGGPDLDHVQGLTVPRRSLYFRHANEKQMVFLKLFDAASVTECYRRSESVVPQQALALANSPLAVAQSRQLAARLWQEAHQPAAAAPLEDFIRAAFETVLGRAPTADERTASSQFLSAQAQRLADPARLTPFVGGDAAPVAAATDPAQRAGEDFVLVLMNHNDFVTIR